MKKNKGIILDLCGGTGSWSQFYKKAGYGVNVITLPQYDILQTKISDDGEFITFKNKKYWDGGCTVRVDAIVGILAAPPCTMFSRARTRASTPRDFAGAMAVIEVILKIVWHCRKSGHLRFWALENPMGLLRQFLGNPAAQFRGWEYGDDHVKFTDLWGYFKMPIGRFKKPREFNQARYASPKSPTQYKHLKLDRAAIRAITPPGFARAFTKINR